MITGASTGIGRHSAEYIANTTKYTVLRGVRKESDADHVRAMRIPNLQPLIIDVMSEESCIDAIESLKSMMKSSNLPLVSVVNNAGLGRRSPIELHNIEDAKLLFDTNFFGLLRLTQMTLPLLRESKGRILMVSSVAGLIGRPMAGIYSASKFALEGLSDALRREVAHLGISVSIIEPAYVKSAIRRWANPAEGSPEEDPYTVFKSKASTETAQKLFDQASDPIVTSTAIRHAIRSPNPKTRYPVAYAASLHAEVIVWMCWLLPDRLEDMVYAAVDLNVMHPGLQKSVLIVCVCIVVAVLCRMKK